MGIGLHFYTFKPLNFKKQAQPFLARLSYMSKNQHQKCKSVVISCE